MSALVTTSTSRTVTYETETVGFEQHVVSQIDEKAAFNLKTVKAPLSQGFQGFMLYCDATSQRHRVCKIAPKYCGLSRQMLYPVSTMADNRLSYYSSQISRALESLRLLQSTYKYTCKVTLAATGALDVTLCLPGLLANPTPRPATYLG